MRIPDLSCLKVQWLRPLADKSFMIYTEDVLRLPRGLLYRTPQSVRNDLSPATQYGRVTGCLSFGISTNP